MPKASKVGLSLGTVALLLAGIAHARGVKQVSLEEAIIYEVYSSFTSAWNRGDPEAMAKFWAEDGDHFATDGRVAQGRAAVQALFAEQLKTTFRGTKLSLTVNSFRFLTQHVAIVNGEYEVTGLRGPDGNEMKAHGLHTDVWMWEDGKWWIAASRLLATDRTLPEVASHDDGAEGAP